MDAKEFIFVTECIAVRVDGNARAIFGVQKSELLYREADTVIQKIERQAALNGFAHWMLYENYLLSENVKALQEFLGCSGVKKEKRLLKARKQLKSYKLGFAKLQAALWYFEQKLSKSDLSRSIMENVLVFISYIMKLF